MKILKFLFGKNKTNLIRNPGNTNRRIDFVRKPDIALNFRMQWRDENWIRFEYIPRGYFERRPEEMNQL